MIVSGTKPINKFLEKFDYVNPKIEVCEENSEIGKKITDCLTTSGNAYKLMDIRKVTDTNPNTNKETSHYVVMLHGGKNGNGKWFEYFSDLNLLFSTLSIRFNEAWLMELDNDCADDVHYVYLGLR